MNRVERVVTLSGGAALANHKRKIARARKKTLAHEFRSAALDWAISEAELAEEVAA